MSKIQINTDTLLNVGAHFGHPSSKWNPNFEKFISELQADFNFITPDQCENAIKNNRTNNK